MEKKMKNINAKALQVITNESKKYSYAIQELDTFESKLNAKNLTISELEHQNQNLKSQNESLLLDLEHTKIDHQVLIIYLYTMFFVFLNESRFLCSLY